MEISIRRLLMTGSLGAGALLLLLVFGGDGVARCLGLGRAQVECVRAHPPTVGLMPPAVALVVSVTVLAAFPWPHSLIDLMAVPAGAIAGAAAYLNTRPRDLLVLGGQETPTAIPLAPEPWGVLFGALAGVATLCVLVSVLRLLADAARASAPAAPRRR